MLPNGLFAHEVIPHEREVMRAIDLLFKYGPIAFLAIVLVVIVAGVVKFRRSARIMEERKTSRPRH